MATTSRSFSRGHEEITSSWGLNSLHNTAQSSCPSGLRGESGATVCQSTLCPTSCCAHRPGLWECQGGLRLRRGGIWSCFRGPSCPRKTHWVAQRTMRSCWSVELTEAGAPPMAGTDMSVCDRPWAVGLARAPLPPGPCGSFPVCFLFLPSPSCPAWRQKCPSAPRILGGTAQPWGGGGEPRHSNSASPTSTSLLTLTGAASPLTPQLSVAGHPPTAGTWWSFF